jgi:hypothetical protein
MRNLAVCGLCGTDEATVNALIYLSLSPVHYLQRVRGNDAPSLHKAAMRQLGRRSG